MFEITQVGWLRKFCIWKIVPWSEIVTFLLPNIIFLQHCRHNVTNWFINKQTKCVINILQLTNYQIYIIKIYVYKLYMLYMWPWPSQIFKTVITETLLHNGIRCLKPGNMPRELSSVLFDLQNIWQTNHGNAFKISACHDDIDRM